MVRFTVRSELGLGPGTDAPRRGSIIPHSSQSAAAADNIVQRDAAASISAAAIATVHEMVTRRSVYLP